MIIGKEKLFQNGCRIRYCVARILLQNKQSFLGDDIEELEAGSFDSAMEKNFSSLSENQKKENERFIIFFLTSIFFFFGTSNFFHCIFIWIK